MLAILDRYILKELLGPFLFGIAAFSCILSGSTVLFYLIGDAIKYGIPVLTVVQLFIFKLPGIIVFTFPMSMLLAAILSFGRLSSDLEILALRAGGIGFTRLVIPVVAAGLCISAMTIWFNETVVPQATHSAEVLLRHYTEKNAPKIRDNINLTEYDSNRKPLRIINVLKVEDQLLKSVTVAEYEQGRLARVITSESGKWLSIGKWEFYKGVMHSFDLNDSTKSTVIEFEKESINIDLNPLLFTEREKTPEEMTIKELYYKIKQQEKLGQDSAHNSMQFHLKFALPFASLIFSLLGASVGLRPHRSSSALGLGISLVIILIYYILMSLGMGLGLSHSLPSIVAAWIPNLVVGVAALYLLKRIAYQ